MDPISKAPLNNPCLPDELESSPVKGTSSPVSPATAETVGDAVTLLGEPLDRLENYSDDALVRANDAWTKAKADVRATKRGRDGLARHSAKRAKVDAKTKTANHVRRMAGKSVVAAQKVNTALHGVKNGLTVVGAAATAAQQYADSTAQTKVGRGLDAATAAGLNVAVGHLAGPAALVDVITGGHLTDQANNSSRAVITLLEARVTGDTAGAESFHQASRAGQYGLTMQTASEIGEWGADYESAMLGHLSREQVFQRAQDGRYGLLIQSAARGNADGVNATLENTHAKMRDGEYGVLFRIAAEAGDEWARRGVSATFAEAWFQFKTMFE